MNNEKSTTNTGLIAREMLEVLLEHAEGEELRDRYISEIHGLCDSYADLATLDFIALLLVKVAWR